MKEIELLEIEIKLLAMSSKAMRAFTAFTAENFDEAFKIVEEYKGAFKELTDHIESLK